MPHYDYSCASCGHCFEAFQNIKEEPLRTCPSCQQEGLVRGIGGGGALFQFKGKGFYLTDYCSKEVSSAKKSSHCGCKGSHSCD